MHKQEIDSIFKELTAHFKETRRTNLNRESKDTQNYTPFQTLISCLLSLRVKDEITEKISKELFRIANTPQTIINLPQEQLEKIIFSSGYYKNKAKTLKRVSEQIINEFNNQVPNTRDELLKLYGVGPKTANIVLCFSFGKNVIPVDINVHRISNRLGWVNTKTMDKTEPELMKIIPEKYWREINGLFILHGKNICVPVSPKCSICPINKYCKRVNVKKSR